MPLYSLTLLALLNSLGIREVKPMTQFYVSPKGNDSWSGRLPSPNRSRTDGPFATLTRARDAVRALKAEHGAATGPITVFVRGGVYPLQETLVFGPEDSGTAECPVIYAAYRNEKPVLTGGRRITGWQKGEGGLWTAHLPEVAEGKWTFRQLFVNGQRRIRARIPNEGYLRTEGPLTPLTDPEAARRDSNAKIGFRFKKGDLKRWEDWEEANVVLYHSWTASWHFIAELDEAACTLRFTAPAHWPVGYWEPKQRYFIENVREALDSPGEWHLDRRTGTLTYWPLPGEDMERAEVIAPILKTLVQFAGEPADNRFVEHLRLEGLSFQYADWSMERHEALDGQAATFLGAALSGVGVRHCSLARCEVVHVGQHAIWLNRGCQDNRVEQCHLHDLGGGGVYIGEAVRGTATIPYCGRNVVHNCFIHDGGHVFPAAVGVWIGQSSHNAITHNEICDFYYTGVSIGWTWGYGPTLARENRLEYNHIHNLGKGVLSDMGGVYTLGVQPGTVVRHNVFHDIVSYSYGGWGLYTDEGSTHILMENNLVYRTKSGGFHQHYGKENIIRNNILAISSEGEVIRSREEAHVSFFFERNLVYQTMGPLLGGNWSNHNVRMDYNLYWHTQGHNELAGMSLEEWREETGQDVHSLVADPKFVNPRRGDFRLQPDSPALKIGFVPFDVGQVGLVGEKAWTDLPKKVKRQVVPLPPPVLPRPVADDFESTPAGEKPANGIPIEAGDATVRVTDETAASGRHSLKFSDAPLSERQWIPHLYYRPPYQIGKLCFSYDLRVEPGAIADMECRDAATPYHTGPRLRVADGKLFASGQELMTVPLGQWVHYEVTFSLGKERTGTYDVSVKIPGKRTQHVRGIPFTSEAFTRLQWVGFMAPGNERTVFYLDNVRLKAVK